MPATEQIDRLVSIANKKAPNDRTRQLRRQGIALAIHQGVTDDQQILNSASKYAAQCH